MDVPSTESSLTADRMQSGAVFSDQHHQSLLRRIIATAAVAIATLLAPPVAGRATTSLPVVADLAEARMGSLLLRDGEHYLEVPCVATDIDITVSGATSRTRVTQIFDNPTNAWVEAIYVNPLPDGGAVDTLKMVIGNRIVIGEIKERVEAKAVYEEARRSGRQAALIEQERPNIFTNSVANIGPGERVVVQIEYQEPIHRSGATSSLRVPLVVAPRYNPVQTGGRAGWDPADDPVPDRDRIAPPVRDPTVEPPTNPISITVHLNAGFPIGEVKSHHHAVTIDAPADDVRLIRLDNGVVPADRDFELTWTPAAAAAPSVGLLREHAGNADYVLALVTPPLLGDAQSQAPPREMVFVIDNSGSMGGPSIAQAKASLLFALDRLTSNDRFNVIRFDHTMAAVFADTVAADRGNVARAKAFVSALQASGGTEMVPPMKAALTDRRGKDSPYLRQVVFLTDGEIGNEEELFDTVAAMRGRSRVFMVGIGSAPNSFLMTRVAEIGRGTYTHIGSVDQVGERMRELIEKLERPIVTGLTVSYSGGAMDATPSVLPDLYRGEPIIIAAKLAAADGELEVRGTIDDRPWTVTLPLAKAVPGEGLSKLWARRKITDAEMAHRLRQASAAETDKRILGLALEHQIVSRLTSLVAVDATPSRPVGAPLTRAQLALNLPAGWEFDKVFGIGGGAHERGNAPPAPPPLERRADAANLPPPAAALPGQPAGITLPKTATDAALEMIAGFLLLALSLLVVAHRRPRHTAH